MDPEPDEEFPYGNATLFHMGSCRISAKPLHDTHGYNMLRMEYYIGFHVFCQAGDNKNVDTVESANSVKELVNRMPFEGTVKTFISGSEVALDGKYGIEGHKPYDVKGYAFAMKIIKRDGFVYRVAVSEEGTEP